jgi:TatA/E family protein of Tat protein translocase
MGKLDGILMLAAVAALLLGAKKLPEFGRNVGESVRELKKSFGPAEDITRDK